MQQLKYIVVILISGYLLSSCTAVLEEEESCTGVDYKSRILSGIINCDATLAAEGGPWLLKGAVLVGKGNKDVTLESLQTIQDNGITLTIEPGTNIKANSEGALVITRGSQIIAEGTKSSPITFSSEDEGFGGSGEWAGVFLQGFAPYYEKGTSQICSAETLCNISTHVGYKYKSRFAGDDIADNSGVMKYVRIAEAGFIVSQEREVESLGLHAVGFGTQLEYIQVHGGMDDGVRMAGGAVNIKHLVLTNNDDDDISVDNGYKGHLQHILIMKDKRKDYPSGANDPRGIEGNNSTTKSVNETAISIANLTTIGGPMVRTDTGFAPTIGLGGKDLRKQPGIYLRGDITTKLINSVVVDFHDCLRIENGLNDTTTATLGNVVTGNCEDDGLSIQQNKLDDSSGALPEVTENNVIHLDDLDIPVQINDNLALLSSFQLDRDVEPEPLSDRTEFKFDKADYAGAVNPGAALSSLHWFNSWIITEATLFDVEAQVAPESETVSEEGETPTKTE